MLTQVSLIPALWSVLLTSAEPEHVDVSYRPHIIMRGRSNVLLRVHRWDCWYGESGRAAAWILTTLCP